MATSNPAFSRDLFAGYEQVYGAAPQHDDDRAGNGRQDALCSWRSWRQRHCGRGTPWPGRRWHRA